MEPNKQYSVITISELESRIKLGDRYIGLVDGVGYVYWTAEPIYFIQKNQGELFAIPIYQQINNPWFADKMKIVYTKTKYTLCVLSREELMKVNRDIYWFYYGPIIEMEKMAKAFVRDATRVERPIILGAIPPEQSFQTNVSAGRRVWNTFDTLTDIADELGLLSKTASKYLSIGKTTINVIDNIGNGKYLDAAGNIVMSLANCSIGLYIDAGVAVWKTDFIQRQDAEANAKEYKRIKADIYREKQSSNPDFNKIRKLEDKQMIILEAFKKNMDNLGIKY